MRVLVCGGRDYDDADAVRDALMDIVTTHGCANTVVIEGGARGADHLARLVAECLSVKVETFHAPWADYGKAAGPIRNQRMIDHGKPDLVLAFPGGRGTADMVRRAEVAGVPVRRPTEET